MDRDKTHQIVTSLIKQRTAERSPQPFWQLGSLDKRIRKRTINVVAAGLLGLSIFGVTACANPTNPSTDNGNEQPDNGGETELEISSFEFNNNPEAHQAYHLENINGDVPINVDGDWDTLQYKVNDGTWEDYNAGDTVNVDSDGRFEIEIKAERDDETLTDMITAYVHDLDASMNQSEYAGQSVVPHLSGQDQSNPERSFTLRDGESVADYLESVYGPDFQVEVLFEYTNPSNESFVDTRSYNSSNASELDDILLDHPGVVSARVKHPESAWSAYRNAGLEGQNEAPEDIESPETITKAQDGERKIDPSVAYGSNPEDIDRNRDNASYSIEKLEEWDGEKYVEIPTDGDFPDDFFMSLDQNGKFYWDDPQEEFFGNVYFRAIDEYGKESPVHEVELFFD